MPKHAIPATWDSFPTALVNSQLPSISDIAILNRRDALIIYLPAVKGAADYRAYIYDSSKVTFAGEQPRGAVLACAGYRQRLGRNVDSVGGGNVSARNRELLQTIEVPGLVNNGNYKIIVEALATPCPFPGVLAHTSAVIPLNGGGSFQLRGFNDVKAAYGNEIINGQGSMVADFSQGDNWGPTDPKKGDPVPPNSTTMPADSVVIARSAIAVVQPAADEAQNGPVFDVGTNAVFDDFTNEGILTSLKAGSRNGGGAIASEGSFGDWFFWTNGVQPALNANGTCCEGDTNPKGVQAWQRHGRLYTTIGDFGQDVMSEIYFASTKTRPQQLDTTKYVHSMFRVNIDSTSRRYWHWMICGGATRDELVDPATGIPRGRPIANAFFYQPGDNLYETNPTAPMFGETKTQYHDKECLSLVQIQYPNWTGIPSGAASWMDEALTSLHAFIHPAGVEHGLINLKPANYGDFGDDNADKGMMWRWNAQRQPTGPMFEPFDQLAPLTHLDIFVRPDRLVFYVNGRQAWCADMSGRPLTMKYGLIAYGDVLYHSGAEEGEIYNGGSGGTFQYLTNTPWSNTRAWDAVSHSEMIDIPPQFTFDPAACFKPKTTAVR